MLFVQTGDMAEYRKILCTWGHNTCKYVGSHAEASGQNKSEVKSPYCYIQDNGERLRRFKKNSD